MMGASMINGMHALIYSRDVAAARAFLSDALGLAPRTSP
jgi:hypothetical protein